MDQNQSAIYKETMQELTPIYGEREAQLMTDMLFQDLLHISKTDRILNPRKEMSEMTIAHLQKAKERLLKHEPIQHILGEAHFYGLVFKVNKHTLVPRPETEELVDLILKENAHPGLSVLDIGTGTGCIAIALAKNLDNAVVHAIDISEEALRTAQENANQNKANIQFSTVNILADELPITDLDIVVSNPPYIPQKEKSQMNQNVIDFDPELALFVPDDDPLLFYREIGIKSLLTLKPGGRLCFEIHEAFGKHTEELLSQLGFAQVELIQDMQGKDRMVRAVKAV